MRFLEERKGVVEKDAGLWKMVLLTLDLTQPTEAIRATA